MKKIGWLSRLSNERPSRGGSNRIAGTIGIAVLLAVGVAVAQDAPALPSGVQDGYTIHNTVDLGGHMVGVSGSGSMYDTLVNIHSGPRVLGQTFTMHAMPGTKHGLFDDLSAFSNGFGGDPINFTRMDVSKGKLYEFSGLFRRDRQYFDYDLLGNANIPSGLTIPIGPATAPTGYYAWPQEMNSAFMYNTVRRMTDTSLTLLPLSKVTFRFAYSQDVMQGPSLTPSGNAVAGQEVILDEFQRNSTDDFTAGVDWKPVQGTKLTYEEQIDHYKGDSSFTMAPQYYDVQEPDGTKVALLDSYQSFVPYGYNTTTGAFSASSNCNTSSMVNSSTILRANPSGGLPIIDPACYVISSYLRLQPTREIFPTEIFRFQSTSIKNVSMNGDVRYTNANMNLPNYYEAFQGLYKADTELAETGNATAKRVVMAADYGVVWQATNTISVEDQLNYSNAQQPGSATFTGGTTVTVPTAAGQETISYPVQTATVATSGAAPDGPSEGGPSIGSPLADFFGLKVVTNNATISWDAAPRATFSLTYRYQERLIGMGPIRTGVAGTVSGCPVGACGTVTINQNGGILNVALRPTTKWDLNGSAEIAYADNAFTPMTPRQLQHYRVHTMYRPRPWATISGAYNDLERHNNTNNMGTTGAFPSATYAGPLDHVDHSRVGSLNASLTPNEHYGLDFNYSFSDVYTSTNSCFQAAATYLSGGAVSAGAATSSGLLCAAVGGTHGVAVELGPVKDFMDAPTQYVSLAAMLSPLKKLHSDIGYRVSSVSGSRLFAGDPREVNGSLDSTYQSPFVDVAWTVHPGLVWKAEYNYYGYGEGGVSGAQYCNANAALSSGAVGTTIPVVPCSSVPETAQSGPAYGFTAPRNFHANNVTLGMHYEF